MGKGKKVAEIIGIDRKKRKRYEEIKARLGELDKILGYTMDGDGMSLCKRARGDQVSQKFFEGLQKRNPEALAEHMALTTQAIQLEDELGITEELIKILEDLLPSDGYRPDIW